MKTILVDAIYSYVLEDGTIFEEMHKILESYPNTKIVLTGANDEQFKHFNLEKVPYEVFTLKHEPEKTDPEYYKRLLEHYNLTAEDVIYFEHDKEAVKSAESVGIRTYFYNYMQQDLDSLKNYIEENL